MGTQKSTLRHSLLLCFLVCLLLLVQLSEGRKVRPSSRNNNNNNNNNNRNNNNRAAGRQRSSRQGRPSRCKDKTTFSLTAREMSSKPFVAKCPRGPIAEALVTGIKGQCQGTSRFIRWSAGRCVWNSTCTLEYSSKPIDTLTPGVKDRTCIGQAPEKLHVSYTCVKRKAPVVDVLGGFQKTKKRAGIVRSHKMYPWSYRNGDSLGNVTFIRPRKPTGLTSLWITVHTYAILDSDIVFLSWEQQTPQDQNQRVQAMRQIVHNDTTFSVPDVQSVILTFFADYRDHHASIGGEEKGFVLCYQWLKANQQPKKNSACTRVMSPAKCRNKRGQGSRRKSNPKSGRTPRPGRTGRNNKRPRNMRPSRKRQQQ